MTTTPLLFIIAIVVLGLLLWQVLRRQSSAVNAKPAPTARATPKDPLANQEVEGAFWQLKAGDVVKFDQVDYFIRRSIQNTRGPYTWFEHRLDDGLGKAFWLSVEDDEGLDLGVWKSFDLVDIKNGDIGDATFVIHGKAFKLIDNGVAEWSNYKSDENSNGTMEHYQYRAADETMASLQNYDGQGWQGSIGQKRLAYEFEIYPSADADSPSV